MGMRRWMIILNSFEVLWMYFELAMNEGFMII